MAFADLENQIAALTGGGFKAMTAGYERSDKMIGEIEANLALASR